MTLFWRCPLNFSDLPEHLRRVGIRKHISRTEKRTTRVLRFSEYNYAFDISIDLV
jgi:hypothetical protein